MLAELEQEAESQAQSNPPDVQEQPEPGAQNARTDEQQDSDFLKDEGISPDELDEKNREVYRKMQAAYTRKMQKLAERERELKQAPSEQAPSEQNVQSILEQIVTYLLQKEALETLRKESEREGLDPEEVLGVMNEYGLTLQQIPVSVKLTKFLKLSSQPQRVPTGLPEPAPSVERIEARPGDRLVDIAARIPGYNLNE